MLLGLLPFLWGEHWGKWDWLSQSLSSQPRGQALLCPLLPYPYSALVFAFFGAQNLLRFEVN